uniref:Uncharacterized protein n=1 Tax=viral metagenome TaxID=1070528 RepID=A0A6M3J5M5_9ZZZZ
MKRLKPVERKMIIDRIIASLSFDWVTKYGGPSKSLLVRELIRALRRLEKAEAKAKAETKTKTKAKAKTETKTGTKPKRRKKWLHPILLKT